MSRGNKSLAIEQYLLTAGDRHQEIVTPLLESINGCSIISVVPQQEGAGRPLIQHEQANLDLVRCNSRLEPVLLQSSYDDTMTCMFLISTHFSNLNDVLNPRFRF